MDTVSSKAGLTLASFERILGIFQRYLWTNFSFNVISYLETRSNRSNLQFGH